MCVCVCIVGGGLVVLHISCERVLMFSKIRRGTDDFMICVFTSLSLSGKPGSAGVCILLL